MDTPADGPVGHDTAPTPHPELAIHIFDGKGGGQAVEPDDIEALGPGRDDRDFAWFHLQRDAPATAKLIDGMSIDRVVAEALMADETRPRCTVHGDGVILILRGVNLNPGAEPEDMISVRLWIEAKRVIGVWLRPLRAVQDLFTAIERGQAPVTPGDLVARLTLRLADRAEPTVASLNERLDRLEEAVIEDTPETARSELASIRQAAIILRRYMFPQRDALTTLEIEDMPWLGDRDRSRLREAADRVTRLGEELDAIRDRAAIIHDQIMDKRAETMNRAMLILAIVAAIFLPLGLVTGLLGINVGGIPGGDDPNAFAIVCALLVILAAGQVVLFRWLRLL